MNRLSYNPTMEYKIEMGMHYNYNTGQFEKTDFTLRRWGNYIVEASPRYGKSALIKHLISKISEFRRVVIFDYGGEWQHDITKFNMDAEYPQCMIITNYIVGGLRVLKNFTFNILSFNTPEDYASMGFDGWQAHIVRDIIKETTPIHNGDISKITEILSSLPIRGSMYRGFNQKYGTTLTGAINASTKTSITTRWGVIRKFFWQGVNDKRFIYNFSDELKNNIHLLIDLTGGDKSDFRVVQ